MHALFVFLPFPHLTGSHSDRAMVSINVKEASWKTHETLTALGHANGLL
jgi:hypothetical protein